MKKVIFIMLIACMAGTAFAQSSIDSARWGRNELMLSLKTLHAESNTPGGFMYRRNFKNVSLRVGVNGNYFDRHRSSVSERQERFAISPSIGIQRNYKLNNYFDIYWGADLFYTYNQYRRESETVEHSTDNKAAGIAPLVGIRYRYKRLVLGIETAGSFSYATHRQHELSKDPFYIPENTYNESMNFNPINSTKFFIGIRF